MSGRRGFLRSIASSAAGGIAALTSRRALAQHEGHVMPKPASSTGGETPPMKTPTGTTMAHGGHGMPMGAPPPLPKGAPPPDSPLYKRFAFDVKVVQHEIVPGVVTHMMAYNGRIPAQTIRVNEGDWVWVDLTNSTDEMHTIHWHGLILEYRHDGVPYVTQDPVMRGEKYSYVFQAKPYGTHFFHCHFGTLMHMQSGMYGAIIIESPDDPIRKRYPYTQDYVYILSSIDISYVREQMNSMFARMRQRDALGARLDLPTQSRFKTLSDMVAAIKKGYVPPYSRARTAPGLPEPDFFLVNGRSYPATESIKVKEGEWIRIRYINAGGVSHSMHMHGHDFYHVCTDGAPLPKPIRCNTVVVAPGRTEDIVFHADNPGFWSLHDHNVAHTTNAGLYPGGAMTHIEYEGFEGTYAPTISLDE